jgi:ATP-binding cassette subfamily B protein
MSEDREEQALGKVYDSQLIKRLWPFVRPHQHWIWVSLVLIPLRAALEVLPAVLIAGALDFLVAGQRSESAVKWLEPLLAPKFGLSVLAWSFVLLMVVVLLGLVIEMLRTYSMIVLGQRTARGVRSHLFRHVQHLPMRFFDRYPVGRLVTRLTTDLENLAEMFSAGVVALVADLFVMVFFAYVLFTVDVRLALAAMVVVPVLAGAAILFRYKVRDAFREVRVKIARINAQLQEAISGIRVVQLFARERHNLRTFAAENASHRDSWFKSIRYDALLFSAVDLANNLTKALIFWFGAGLLGYGGITLGTLYLFSDYMVRFFRPLLDLSAKYSVMQSSMASAERTFQLIDEQEELPESVQSASDSQQLSRAAEAIGAEVVFDDVTFGYGDQPVLKNVSFRVAPGQRVALVGATGSGKTTTLKLLARLYELQQGSIRVDGVDVREWSRGDLRRLLAFVLQDVFLFEGSLGSNITLDRGDRPAEALREALRSSHVDDLVDRLPEGLEHTVSERGSNFSTGERQLLSFARALYGEPRILLLDEATSSVDTETEARIQDALHKLLLGRTSIVVAHRLSTIQDADRIFVFHKGEICEEGNHQELLEQRGIYWRLYQLQFAQEGGAAA